MVQSLPPRTRSSFGGASRTSRAPFASVDRNARFSFYQAARMERLLASALPSSSPPPRAVPMYVAVCHRSEILRILRPRTQRFANAH